MFYLLTDSMNAGDIIREETGKHYIYSYTRNTWERTGIFYDYFKRESPLYRQYHTISEAETTAHIELRRAEYDHLLALGNKALFQACFGRRQNGRPLIEEKLEIIGLCIEIEAKIVAAYYQLHEAPAALTADALQNAGLSLRMAVAYQALIPDSDESRADYYARVRSNTIAADVKYAELQVLARDGDHRQQMLSDIALLRL